MPLVSVVIPTHDRATILPRAITSVLAQTHADLELIVVDDASTDDTQDRLAAYDDDRVRVIRRTRRSGGASAPRSDGMAEARGDWIAFLDSDDEWLPHKLTAQLEAASADTALVYSRIREVHLDGEVTLFPSPQHLTRLPTGDVTGALLGANFVATSTMMIARAWADRVGGFDARLPGSEDWEWCLRVALAGGSYAAVDEPTAVYHFHEHNISSHIDWLAADLMVYRTIRPIAGPHRTDVDRHRRDLQWRIRRARSRAAIRTVRALGTAATAR